MRFGQENVDLIRPPKFQASLIAFGSTTGAYQNSLKQPSPNILKIFIPVRAANLLAHRQSRASKQK